MNPAAVTRWLRWLYGALAVLSAVVTVAALVRGQYGSAALNGLLTVVWTLLFWRLSQRRRV